jgi:hypothetical protein
MLLSFAIDQVVWKFQFLEVQFTFAMYAVPERSKAVAQLSWKLMHRWTCLGVCCGSCMTVLETFEGTLKSDRHCLSSITILDQLLLPSRLPNTPTI